MSSIANDVKKSAFPVLDMIMGMQRLSMQAMSAYLDSTIGAERAFVSRSRPSALRQLRDTNEEQVIGIGEEVLNVGTRMVPGKITRVRRVVVQASAEQDVTLHSETVVLERRKPTMGSNNNDLLTEVTVEMSDFNEVPVVSKSVHLVEEVLLRKEVTTRIEKIRDTVRRDKLEIEQPSNLPAVVAAPKQEEKGREEGVADDVRDKKQMVTAPQAGHKPGDQKRL